MIAAIVLLVVVVAAFFIPPSTTTGGDQQIISGIRQSGGSCVRDGQCFVATCEGSGTYECLNATQTDFHVLECEHYYDFDAVQDLSRCACIQGRCQTPS